MKILVTGGSGFIGKAFIKTYKKTFDIVAPSQEEMNLLDARSINKVFASHKFDAVVHLAGLPAAGGETPLEADNLIMFKNIQYLAIAHGVKKLITVGEGVEFDTSQPIVDYTEDMFGKVIPQDGYGLGRYLINLLASKDKITTVLRLFEVYGVGGTQYPINKIVTAASRGKAKIVIDRDRVVSAISVDDAVKAIAAFIMRDYPKGDYNLVAGDKMSYVEIAKTVKRILRREGGDIEIVVKNPTPLPEYSASNAKLLEVVPMSITSMQSGVKKLYEQLKK
ncbi:MAG: sugar nucleotide-binding protein [Clostridiales bacterium]|nr:sugar nucleotide-binding protein [Clostridiales bacterium]